MDTFHIFTNIFALCLRYTVQFQPTNFPPQRKFKKKLFLFPRLRCCKGQTAIFSLVDRICVHLNESLLTTNTIFRYGLKLISGEG